MTPAVIPPEIIALVGALVAGGALVGLLLYFARSSAVEKDDRIEAERGAKLQREAEEAARKEAEKNRDL